MGMNKLRLKVDGFCGVLAIHDNATDHRAATIDSQLANRPTSPLRCIGWFVVIYAPCGQTPFDPPESSQPAPPAFHQHQPATVRGPHAVRQVSDSSSSSPPKNSAGVQINNCPSPSLSSN